MSVAPGIGRDSLFELGVEDQEITTPISEAKIQKSVHWSPSLEDTIQIEKIKYTVRKKSKGKRMKRVIVNESQRMTITRVARTLTETLFAADEEKKENIAAAVPVKEDLTSSPKCSALKIPEPKIENLSPISSDNIMVPLVKPLIITIGSSESESEESLTLKKSISERESSSETLSSDFEKVKLIASGETESSGCVISSSSVLNCWSAEYGSSYDLEKNTELAELPFSTTDELSLEDDDDTKDGVYNLSRLFNGYKWTGKQQKRKYHTSASKDSPDRKKSRPRVNYFVAVQVSNSEIIEKARLLLQSMKRNQPNLEPAFIPTESFHITLAVFHARDEQDVKKASAAMDLFLDRILHENLNDPLHLELESLGHFQNQVVYMNVKPSPDLDRLSTLADIVTECLEKSGFFLEDGKGFRPHVTVAKISRSPKLYKQGVKKIPASVYREYESTRFGLQTVTTVQLLSMNKPKDQSGYYYCSKEIHLGPDRSPLTSEDSFHSAFTSPTRNLTSDFTDCEDSPPASPPSASALRHLQTTKSEARAAIRQIINKKLSPNSD